MSGFTTLYQDKITEWSQGDMGAYEFLIKLSRFSPFPQSSDAFRNIERLNIRGISLYILYNDLCERDLSKVVRLVNYCPCLLLEDACSRQDYSGRKIVAKYINEKPNNHD